MMIERQILEALQTATLSAVAASTMPTLQVQPMGRTLTPPPDKWLEIVYIPNNVNGEFWSSGKTYRGLYRLLLHWSVDDEGVYSPMDVLASVCAHFPIGALFQKDAVRVKIYQEPDLAGVIQRAPELIFLVTIRYETFQR